MAPSNVATGSLPEKEWFSLNEIAERWGCSEHYLIHLAGVGKLRVGVIADAWILEIWNELPLPAHSRPETPTDDHEAPESQSRVIPIDGFVTVPPTVAQALEHHTIQPLTEFDYPRNDEPKPWSSVGSVGVAYIDYINAVMRKLIATEESRHTLSFLARVGTVATSPKSGDLNAPRVCRSELAITRIERDRFEREWRVGAYAGAMPEADQSEQLDPRERTTYRQLVALMVADMELPAEPYKAAECLRATAAKHGLEVRSRETLAKIIRELDQ
jgi:hypothetical protein